MPVNPSPEVPPDVAAGLRFEAKDHTYWVGNRRIMGVSQLLEACELKKPFFGDASGAMKLGTEVHKLTELMDHGEDRGYDFSPEAEEYRAGWLAFRKAFPFEILECEQPRYDKGWDFAGTPDRIVTWRRARTVVEIKTGKEYDWHSYQTACYGHLAGCHRRLIVYLGPKRPYGFQAEEHKDKTDWMMVARSLSLMRTTSRPVQIQEPAMPRVKYPWEKE